MEEICLYFYLLPFGWWFCTRLNKMKIMWNRCLRYVITLLYIKGQLSWQKFTCESNNKVSELSLIQKSIPVFDLPLPCSLFLRAALFSKNYI